MLPSCVSLPNPEPLPSLILIPSTPGFSIGILFLETHLLLHLRLPDTSVALPRPETIQCAIS